MKIPNKIRESISQRSRLLDGMSKLHKNSNYGYYGAYEVNFSDRIYSDSLNYMNSLNK